MTTSPGPPSPAVIVSTRFRLAPSIEDRDIAELLASDEGVTLEFDGQQIRFDASDDRTEGFIRVIDSLARQERPVAFELDSEGRIARLFTPHVSPVRGLRQLDRGVIAVELVASHGRHTLRDTHPAFEELQRALMEATQSGATVIVTEDDDHTILDVQLGEGEGEPPFTVGKPVGPSFFRMIRDVYEWFIRWFRCSCSFPWGWFRSISPAKAQQVFDSLAARSCDPLTVPAPCIPFMYPDDGCWGRAHEMCRLMQQDGLKPCKVWIQGSLDVSTDNNPSCAVWWGWHVAPTHCVRGSGLFGFLRTRSMVFDPALFTTPVTRDRWKSVQGDTTATLTTSEWSVFYLWGSGSGTSWFSRYDPAFAQTNSVLAFYRTVLQNRAVQYGPPPYACP